MPMTLHYLRTELDAVVFTRKRRLCFAIVVLIVSSLADANKVGLNSRPNGYVSYYR